MVKPENNLKQKKTKIGILGGTFDPAHKGHLEISKQAKKILELKNIIWAITKQNPFKNTSETDLKNRIKFAKKIILFFRSVSLVFLNGFCLEIQVKQI